MSKREIANEITKDCKDCCWHNGFYCCNDDVETVETEGSEIQKPDCPLSEYDVRTWNEYSQNKRINWIETKRKYLLVLKADLLKIEEMKRIYWQTETPSGAFAGNMENVLEAQSEHFETSIKEQIILIDWFKSTL